MAVRRKRIQPEQPQVLWGYLGRLPIDIEPALTTVRGKEVLAVAEKHNLTVYDAAYLELARRYQLPLGTLDADLRKEVQADGLQLL
jgi:predicted nucleic acid-binding protein